MTLEFELDIFNETATDMTAYYKQLEDILLYTLKNQKQSGYIEACIVFVSNEKIKELNRDYRSKDSVTDVISFAMEDKVEGESLVKGDDLPRILGDIYISIDQCSVQANEYGHSFERELIFLALHGFLHLLGYDHLTKEEEKIMFSLQEEILNANEIKR